MPDAETSKSGSALPTIGSYKLVQQLGSGGMSSVFRALHAETGHEVAVKVLPRYLAKNPTLLQRFLREAKSAEALEHPNIVSIYDRGSEQGRYYLVLEYVSGGDLHDRVKSQGPLGVAEATNVIKAVCRGLSHAAGRGVIHRDIKPANLLVTPEGQVKIIDLGLALQVEEEDERVTRDGTTVGTVDYMSPEQARDSRATSVCSDIYSLGCTFYYILTGSPPYPGGDVSDKLRRHASGPVPDVRKLRPEVPEALARLIRKMMAKRPEKRFATHDELIDVLDAVSFLPAPAPAAPLYALIDEEDDDDDVDDGEAMPFTLGPGAAGGAAPIAPRRSARVEEPIGATLAELAGLDDDAPAARSARRGSHTLSVPSAPEALIDEDDESEYLGNQDYATAPAAASAVRHADDVSVRDWILRGLMIGVAIVVVGVALQQLIAFSTAQPEPPQDGAARDTTEAPEPAQVAAVSIPKKPAPKPISKRQQKVDEARAPEAAWVEPADVAAELPAESTLPTGQEARFLPGWTKANAAQPGAETSVVAVRRLEPTPGRDRAQSLVHAMDLPGGTIELADNGPFFEHDLRAFTKQRLIRAAKGYRPIVVLEPPVKEFTRSQSSLVHVDGGDLTIEGIDLVVRASDPTRPSHLTNVFLCRGGDLTLRDCTVTVAGDGETPFTLVRIGDAGAALGRPVRVRLERTFVRGGAVTAVHLADGASEVVISRSALLCGDAAALVVSGRAPAGSKVTRRIHLVQDIVAARRSILELSFAPGGAGAGAPVIRAIGCTFARIDGTPPAGFLDLKGDSAAAARSLIDWSGELNILTGWSAWMTAGPAREVKVAGVVEARETWGQTDEETQVLAKPWPQTLAKGWSSASELEAFAPGQAGILRRVAQPSPFLWEKTLGTFARLPLPPLTFSEPDSTVGPALGAPGPARGGRGPAMVRTPTAINDLPATTKVPARSGLPGFPAAASPAPPPLKAEPGVKDLTFDAQAAAWKGDLGRFLRESVTGADRRVRVQAFGFGEHAMYPLRLPPGIALEILVMPPAAGGTPLSWSAPPGLSADALIDAPGSDLTLVGVRLRRDGGERLRSLIRVEDGRLTLVSCWLRAPWDAETGGGRLVRFRAAQTRPLPPPAGVATGQPGGDLAAARLIDCLLITGGDGIDAELGMGVVALANCAVASGTSAFVLRPQAVSRRRFAADLWLDRCTVVADQAFVGAGQWLGTDPGPDRPWLISTNSCAFLDAHSRGRVLRHAVMIRADGSALARGSVFWQADRDAYDVSYFLAPDKSPPVAERKSDVVREWVDLWGSAHIRSVSGPRASNAAASGISLAERPRPGDMAPTDLALNPGAPKARYVGADLNRLGIQPPAPPPRASGAGGRRLAQPN